MNEVHKGRGKGLVIRSACRTVVLTGFMLLAILPGATGQMTNTILSLDGNGDYVTIPSAPELQNPTGITVEAWMYPMQTGNDRHWFINKGDRSTTSSQRSYEVRWVASNGDTGPGNRLEIQFFLGTTNWAIAGVPFAPDQWVHVAATYQSSLGLLQLYTNGILADKTTTDKHYKVPLAGNALRQSTLPVDLGACMYVQVRYAAGYMDEVRIWNKARTPVEILADTSRRLTGAEANLVGYWTFEDGTARDATGRGHNGTFMGGAVTARILGFDEVHAGFLQPRFLPITVANGLVSLNCLGQVGSLYRFDYSTNLIGWAPLTTISNTQVKMQMLELTAGKAQRFYRVIIP